MKSIKSITIIAIWSLISLLITNCNQPNVEQPVESNNANQSQVQSTTPPNNSAPTTNSNKAIVNLTTKVKFKQGDASELFSLKPQEDGAKLESANGQELARFTIDAQQKIKIKNASDEVLDYVVTKDGYWKLENAQQNQELYVLRKQSDGGYKLESGSNQEIYRIKARDYGWEIETPQKESLYKVKNKDGKISLRNAQDQTVIYTKDTILPIAVVCFGFDILTKEQRAGLAYAVQISEGN
jgi:hypothetical protein